MKKFLNGIFNGSTQEKNFKKITLKEMYPPKTRETVQNKKFIHMKNHLNEQVIIELVFYNFLHMKKAGGY